jgi:nucleoside-diphosphate-sugar epimerase
MKILITGAAGGIGSTLGYHPHKKGTYKKRNLYQF